MIERAEMKVTYIDPDQRALFVAELPDGGYGAWTQKGKDAPRKQVSKNYIRAEGYATFAEAQEALALYVSSNWDSHGSWDIFVNGKRVTRDDYFKMRRGELAAPFAAPPNAQVALANIEYRIATHIQGVYTNILEVGHCLIEAKESGLVPHGEWEAWVRRNTYMSERQAQKLMQAARSVLPGSAMERLPISKIQAILMLPEPEREPMAEKAVGEGMSVDELRAAIKAQKDAEEYAQKLKAKLESTERDAQIYLNNYNTVVASRQGDIANAEQLAREAAQAEIDGLSRRLNERISEERRLRRELDAALEHANASSSGISPEAQAEIERLEAQLAEQEAYVERQARARADAQSKLLALQTQMARGGPATGGDTLCADDFAGAVRMFLGQAGVLPHMGAQLARVPMGEREKYEAYLRMIADWCEGARRALDTMEGGVVE